MSFETSSNGSRTTAALELNSNNSANFFGDVGIGINAPSEKLDVYGNINVSGTIKVLGSTAGQSNYSGEDENTAFTANNYPHNGSTNCSKIVLRHDNGTHYGAEILGGLGEMETSTGTSQRAPWHLDGGQRFAINVFNGSNTSTTVAHEPVRALSIDSGGTVDIPKLMVQNINAVVLSSYVATSDDRIKFDEKNVNDCMALVNELVPFRYNIISKQPYDASGIWMPTDASWNDVSNNFNYNNQYGFIAQDVGDISGLEMLVKGEPLDACGNQTILSLEYNSLFTIGIGAIKELHQLISSQATTISALEARVRILENS